MKFSIVIFVFLLLRGISSLMGQTPDAKITVGENFSIKSKILGEEREIQIYLPASYNKSKQNYPVIYTLDGEGTGSITANSVEFMTGYSAIPQMPDALVVGITNTNRNRDLPIPEGYGKAGEANFLTFLTDELIPTIEQKYRTQPLRILLGHSQGGLFAHYAMTERPTIFQWVLSIDAPLAGFSTVKPIMEKTKLLISKTPNYHGRLVTIENLYGWRKEWASLAEIAPKSFYAAQVEIKDETHETMAFKGIYEGLKRLFHDYAPNLVRDKRTYTLPELEKRYKELSESYGYQVEIPKEILLTSADQNIAIQHGAEAVALIKKAVTIYGESLRSERQLEEAETAVKKGRDSRLEEWANLSPPTIESMKNFLGTWERKGDATWIISFEVKDGAVHPQNTVIPPSSDPFHLEVQFVRVLEGQKIQWGERNGKGSGVTVYTAKIVDANTISGTAERIGFIMPPPPFSFTYKRRTEDRK